MSSLTLNTLKQFSPFDSLSDDYLTQLLSHAEIYTAKKGQLLFKRGKVAPDFYFLLQGEVSLVDSLFYARVIYSGDEDAQFALNAVNNPTKVSAVAQNDAEVLRVSKEHLDQILAWSQSANEVSGEELPEEDGRFKRDGLVVDEGDWSAHLLSSPMFTRIPPANLQGLFQRFEAVEVAAGQVIVKVGELGDFFYVIASGRARVLPLGEKTPEPVFLNEGDFFGEEALVGETTRNATVEMETSGWLMRLGKEDFKDLLQSPLINYVNYADLDELAKNMGDVQLIDVRLPLEHRHLHLENSLNIPLNRLRSRLSAMERGHVYVITDDAGARSQVAAQLLIQQGHNVMILQSAEQHYVQGAA